MDGVKTTHPNFLRTTLSAYTHFAYFPSVQIILPSPTVFPLRSTSHISSRTSHYLWRECGLVLSNNMKFLSHEGSMTFCGLTKYNGKPPPIRLYTNTWLFIPNSTFYWLMRGFHRTFAMGVACWQGTLTPPDTWSRSNWVLHMFYLSLFFRTILFHYPLVLSQLCFTSSGHLTARRV